MTAYVTPRFLFLAFTVIAAASAAAQTAVDFAQAEANADAQRERDPMATFIYSGQVAETYRMHRLDGGHRCEEMSGGLTHVLEIDASGKVVGYFADRDTERTRCWRTTYLGMQLPAPPTAPYWHEDIFPDTIVD